MTPPRRSWSWAPSSSCSSGTACRSASSRSWPRSALWATGLVTTQEAVAGFGDPVVIFIATLFVVSEGIDSTGVTTWAGRGLLDRAGTAHARVLVAVCGLSALLTSLITLNGAIAALLPLVVLLAQRIGRSPSQLLMPVAFAGSAGGLLMLMSSPVNVIVSEASDEAGAGTFPFFSFALVGDPAPDRHGRDLPGPRAEAAARAGPRAHAAGPRPARRDPRGAVRPERRVLPAAGAVGVGADRYAARPGRGPATTPTCG